MSTPHIGEIALARGVTATWWYTAVGVATFVAFTAGFWMLWAWASPELPGTLHFEAACVGAAAWLASSVLLLMDYRPNVLAVRDGESHRPSKLHIIGHGLAAAGALLLGYGADTFVATASVVAFVISVRPWTPGVRWRIVVGATLALGLIMYLQAHDLVSYGMPLNLFVGPAVLVLMTPSMTAFSLWWWEIVLELDRARAAESQLAATRERLRLANDVHDLQGHHLQVIALQLELAERLLTKDPKAAAAQIKSALTAVDEARAGTRALATSFRGVPLPDELENAADLLRAAGHDVRMHVGAGAASAPAEVLGPIVRESVTNTLKHGDGRTARIELTQERGAWVYRMTNDAAVERAVAESGAEIAWGSGLAGMRERLSTRGGEVEAWNDGTVFTVQVRLPVIDGSELAATPGGRE